MGSISRSTGYLDTPLAVPVCSITVDSRSSSVFHSHILVIFADLFLFNMKRFIASAVFFLILLSMTVAHPKPAAEGDDEEDDGSSVTAVLEVEHSSQEQDVQNATWKEEESSMEERDEEQRNEEIGGGFDLALFPGSSAFVSATFQKLRESLSSIRDQLNSMWSTSSSDLPSFTDLPDGYTNRTSQSKVSNPFL